MTRSSRFLLPFALIALASSLAVAVPRAAAVDPYPPSGVATLSSDHFQIHYSRDVAPCPTAAISQEQAGEVLGMAERAYALYSGWGYTAPGAPVDISVGDFSIDCFAHGAIPLGTPMPHGRWGAVITPGGSDEIHLSAPPGPGYHVRPPQVFPRC